MVFPEEVTKRFETLIQAIKLLGEEYQKQRAQISKLQEEVTQLRTEVAVLKKKVSLEPLPVESTISHPEKVSETANESLFSTKTPPKKPEPLLVADSNNQKLDIRSSEQDSDKRDLLEALKIIDNL